MKIENSDNTKASLFVGRWQPFHKGHKKLVESVLKQGKQVVIAIRDTEISKQNPFTVSERWTMIQKQLRKYGELVKIITIPDIDEVCYGRDVGFGVRRNYLKDEIEKISATSIRKKKVVRHPILWITGQTRSGKTTLAKALQKKIGGVILDGDEMRRSISLGSGFSKQDRHYHNLRVARLAEVLSRDNPVIVSVIAPFEETRKELTKMIDPIWIYVKRRLPKEKDKPYEVPKNPHVIVDRDRQTVNQELDAVLKAIKRSLKTL
jgi:cytidyltransferase-like protein